MKRNFLMVMALIVFSQISIASDVPTTITPQCLNKISKFAYTFALANQMNMGEGAEVKIDKVTINQAAMAIGESSGFAKGTGSIYTTVKFDGDESEASRTNILFTYAQEPHCAVMAIRVEGLQD